MSDRDKYPRVCVEWIDSCGVDERWHSIQDATACELRHIMTMGFLVHEDDEKMIVVASVSDVEHCAGGSVIPKVSIVRWDKLEANRG